MTTEAGRPIRVLVVDDDLFVRTALGGFVSAAADLRLVGQCENGRQAVAEVASEVVDVVLMDLQMPVLDGIGAAAQIRAISPATRVLVLTSFDEETSIRSALEAGASGYLLKSTPPDTLIAAIRTVHGGTGVLSDASIRRLTGPSRRPPRPSVALSASEGAVLRLLCQGHSNPAIAARLFLSESTVKVRLASLGDKLGTSSRVTTAIRGWELGLAADEGD
ncbi:MAG TPA: response regulator transcription factor [Micropruina sp.]|nr:response regulator transcription factor [Micropruina sp.]